VGVTRPIPSEAEISVLEALVAEGEEVLARSAARDLSYSVHLCRLDPQRRFFVIAASAGRLSPDALPADARVSFEVLFGEWRVAFSADHPHPVTHEGKPAVQLEFPASISITRRRQHARASVPRHGELRLVAYSGAAPIFEATITDVGRGGLGLVLEFGGDSLHPGMVLGACRIERKDGEPVTVDLEVRHTNATILPDGKRVVRAGCRFLALSAAATRLVEEYLANHSDGD
jgi:c-di-GMP-binding flagellar brake protein YcgR